MFQPLRSLLPNILKRYQIHHAIEATLICEEMNKLMQSKLPHHKDEAVACSYHHGIITIQVTSGSIMSEIQMNKQPLLEALCRAFPHISINGIRCVMRE